MLRSLTYSPVRILLPPATRGRAQTKASYIAAEPALIWFAARHPPENKHPDAKAAKGCSQTGLSTLHLHFTYTHFT